MANGAVPNNDHYQGVRPIPGCECSCCQLMRDYVKAEQEKESARPALFETGEQ